MLIKATRLDATIEQHRSQAGSFQRSLPQRPRAVAQHRRVCMAGQLGHYPVAWGAT